MPATVNAQCTTSSKPTINNKSACPAPGQLPPSHLHGLWQLAIWPMDADPDKDKPSSTGAVLFYQHPEYADSVRGRLMRTQGKDSVAAVTVGDLLGGVFKMDESPDGVRLVGTWEGAISGDGCGNEISGSRLPIEGEEAPPQAFQFELKKVAR